MSERPPLTRVLTNDIVPFDPQLAPREDISRTVSKLRDDARRVPEPVIEIGEEEQKGKAHGKGLTEGDEDFVEIPNNNLWLVMPALGLVAFVSALDQTIIAAALPTIAAELNASPAQYSWVGTSYLLAQTLMTPVNGRLTDIIGRKPALYTAISVMIIFSILCATAKSIEWLIIARAFAGLGGGSIVGMTLIVLSDIIPLQKRAAFQGYMGVSWGSASVIGPLLGGLFTAKLSWRWCFWINLPTCGLALIMLFFTLNLPPLKAYTWQQFRKTFDFLGLFLVISGACLLIVGFSSASDNGFGSPKAYGVIAPGVVITGLAVAHCLTTKRNAVIPAVRGATVLSSGLMLIPFCVTCAFVGVFAGEFQTRTHSIRPIIWVGFGITSLGYFLMYAFYTSTVSFATQEGLQIITSAGAGLSFSTPMLVIQSAMPFKDMAAATSGWVLVRSMGATIGLAVLQAISNSGIRSRFTKIPGYGVEFQLPTTSAGYKALHDLPNELLRDQLLDALANSIRVCFALGGGLLAFNLFLTIFTKQYSVSRMQGPKTSTEVIDVEAEGDKPGQKTNTVPSTIPSAQSEYEVNVRRHEEKDAIAN